MGTLTGDVSRLPGFCDHKLPTSCRLTSIPLCCACADERAHAPSYSTYIDGIGFVSRGTRWQRYCWFCKEFWESRVAATNLRPSQTRIPEVPDQSTFLERWYEFHRGYRIIKKEDGTEERIAVIGEPFRDVSPGYLPRSVEELRAGRDRNQAPQEHIHVPEEAPDTGPSLDATLDQLFEAAAAEEPRTGPRSDGARTSSSHDAGRRRLLEIELHRVEAASNALHNDTTGTTSQAMQAINARNREYQNRRIAALRRELHRMRNGIERVISGLRELGEFVPYPAEATGRLITLGRTLDDMEHDGDDGQRATPAPAVGAVYRDPALTTIQQRLDEAIVQLNQAQRFRDQSSQEFQAAQSAYEDTRQVREEAAEVLDAADLDLADHRAQSSQLRRELRTAENYYRVFGSREEFESQGSEYISPIGGMFNRAWERFRVAEDVRREERTLRQIIHDEQSALGQEASAQDTDTVLDDQLAEYYSTLRLQDWTQTAPHVAAPGESEANAPTPNLTPSQPPSRLEHLLRNTPEPERSAIIARMRENGTAQALEEPLHNGLFDLYQRLGATSASSAPHPYAGSDDSTDEEEQVVTQGLDVADTGRPDPKEDEDMMHKLDCKVCYSQIADTACLPCGHLVMCQWCSEQHSPVMQHDHTRPRNPANCPVCRKRIKQKVRIYRA